MAERRIVTKIAYDTSEVVKGAAAGRAALSSFADVSKTSTSALEREYRRLVGAINPAEKSQLAFARAVATTNELVKKGRLTQEQANETLRKADAFYRSHASQVGSLGGLYEKLGGKIVGAFAGYKLLQLGRRAVDEAVDAAKAQALLESAVRSTGGAAGFTAKELDEMASSFSVLAGVDDEVIAGAEAILLRYKGITGEQFPRAIQLALDMASAQGEQITSTSQLAGEVERLGKLLGDPARASQLLKREGKALDEQQLRSIQTFLRQNDLVGAQKVLFAELERQYGGTAEALRGTVGGAIQATEVAWGNLLEEVGKGLLFDVTGIENLADALTDPKALESARSLGEGLGQIAAELLKITSYNDEINSFLNKLSELQEAWARIARGEWRLPQLTYTPLPNYTPIDSGAPPPRTPPKPPAPPVDSKALAAADKLRETFARIMAEHEETKRTQQELLALYTRTGVTVADRLELEEEINDRHRDRVTYQKALGQFADLGARKAAEMAAALVRASQEERERARAIETANVKLEAARNRALDYLEATQEIKKAWESIRFPDMANLLQQLQALSIEEARDLIAGRDPDDVRQANAEMFAALESDYREFWQDFNLEVRGGLMTNREVAEQEMAKIRAAYQIANEKGIQGALDIAEREEALYQIRAQLMDQTLSDWGTFFGFMGDIFGGFMQDVANAISRVQSAYQQGRQLDASGFGSAAGLSGSFGAIFATAAIFAEIYKAVSTSIKREAARTWGDVTSVQVVGGEMSSPSYFNQAGRDASFALREMIEQIVDSLDAVLDNLPQIVIRARRDGKEFSAYVAGIWVGTFRDAQTALEEAVAVAIQQADFSHISEEFALALRASVGATMDELEANLETARAARGARLGDTGAQYVEVSDRWRREMEAAQRLGLAVDDMIKARERELDAIKNNVLGIDTSIADQLRAIGSLNRGIAEAAGGMRATLEDQIEATRRQIAELERRARAAEVGGGSGVVGGGAGGGTGSPGDRYTKEAQTEWDQALARLRQQLAEYLEQLDKIPQALSDQEIDMGIFRALFRDLEGTGKYTEQARKYALMEVEIRYAQIRLELEALGKWEQFAQMWEDARQAATETAGRSQRRGGGGQREGVRDWLDDNAFRLAAERMGDVERQLAEMNRTYDEQAEQVKAGSAEMARLNAQRREEAELIRQRGIATGYEGLREYEGGNPFEAERQRAAALTKAFDDLLKAGAIGQERYERAVGRVNSALERHLDLLGQQESATLFGQLAGLLGQAGLGESLEAQQLLAEQQRANFVLQLTEAQLRYQQLVAENHLIGRNKDLVEGALNRLAGIDLDKVFVPGGGGGPRFKGYDNVIDAGDRFNNTLEDSRKLFDSYKDARLDQTAREVQKIQDDFAKIFRDLGRGPEVLAEFDAALQETFDELTGGIRDVLDRLQLGDLSPLSPTERVAEAERRYRELYAKAEGGDLEAYRQVGGAGEDFLRELRAAFATSPEFWADFSRIQEELERLLGRRPFSHGGIASEASIFGEAGPEAAVPLPDGRSIPVAFSSSGLTPIVAAIDKSGRETAFQMAMLARKMEMQVEGIAGLREDIRTLISAVQRSIALQEGELKKRGAAA